MCLVWVLLLTVAAHAERIGQSAARSRAVAFLQERGRATVSPARLRSVAQYRQTKAEADYYVFNVGDAQGFVIVSGDDRTVPILGYADSGRWDEDALPDGLQYLIDGYLREMAALDEMTSLSAEDADARSYRSARHAPAAARTPIAPLITTHWDQGAPYNALCPLINGTRSPVGCLATTMAQVMYYHRWPAATRDTIPGYNTSRVKMSDLEPVTFEWSSMTPTYGAVSATFPDDITAAQTAVAQLMLYCGVSIQMNYNASSSSAYNSDAATALMKYFDYDPTTVTLVQRCHYTYADWVSLIYAELALGRPVMLGGQASGGGHSFVCDGFDTDDYFHINWGWGGSSDGYFRLSVLQPWEQGIGGSSTLDGFSFDQDAVVGIQPSGAAGPAPSPVNPIETSVAPAAAVLTVTGNQTKGYEQQVTASITAGDGDFHGDVLLRVNNKPVMGKTLDIPSGKTVDAHYVYTPTVIGDNVLTLWTAKTSGTQIGGSTTVTIAESDATDDLDLTFNVTPHNVTAGGLFYGNAIRAAITVTNPSTLNSYAGQVNCSVRKWTPTDNGDNTVTWNWESVALIRSSLVVPRNSTATVDVAQDGLEPDGFYSLRITYKRTTEGSSLAEGLHYGLENGVGTLQVTGGYALGDAAGNTTVLESASAIDAGDACFLDLRSMASLDGVTITPSSNPNCLYLLPAGAAVPLSLSGCNVVCGTTAAQLTLTDGHDFYSPIAFTADQAAYTRTFTLAANGSSGWNTLMLPFTATAVSCALGTAATDQPVDWFRSDEDTNKNFWLRTFTADDDGAVTFDYAQSITANTPYIIAVPDHRFGSEYQMTDRPVTFSATNAAIAATRSTPVGGNHYKFQGTTTRTVLSNVYVLNASGGKFVRAAADVDVTIPAFRAWFTPVSISSLTIPALAIRNSGATGIGDLNAKTGNAAQMLHPAAPVYDLTGRPVIHSLPRNGSRGLYLYNGKKILVK